ncbi:MAG: Hsp20/alpha crystallin family protein [Sedimentisphaerales bacterium]|nr:Hsp20/alpha crystallin family protein [Sedimentisphaerales bacterium]
MAKKEITKREKADVVSTEKEKAQYYQPATDVRETEKEVILQFDMPGVSSDHVELTVEKGTLTVTGTADPEEQGHAVYRETHIGNYRRIFSLNEGVDTEHIQADMKAGVLTVRIPKPEKAKPKRIAIKSA